jgi:hypothetical protein
VSNNTISREAFFVATSRSSSKPWTIQKSGVSSSGEGKAKSRRRTIWNITLSDASIAVPLISPSPCDTCGSPIENNPPSTATG